VQVISFSTTEFKIRVIWHASISPDPIESPPISFQGFSIVLSFSLSAAKFLPVFTVLSLPREPFTCTLMLKITDGESHSLSSSSGFHFRLTQKRLSAIPRSAIGRPLLPSD
jgi:hypothetical protein